MNNERATLQQKAQKLVDAELICRAWEMDWYMQNMEKIPSSIKEVSDEEIWDTITTALLSLGDPYRTVCEWYKVHNRLARELKNEGEIIVEMFNSYYWGRTHAGQSVILDWVIQQIAQKYYRD